MTRDSSNAVVSFHVCDEGNVDYLVECCERECGVIRCKKRMEFGLEMEFCEPLFLYPVFVALTNRSLLGCFSPISFVRLHASLMSDSSKTPSKAY